MLVDVSHLSEGGFYDVADICKKPFVATHSNSITLSPHQRNLTDDQIRVLGKAEGFNMDEIEKIFHKNVLRAIKESMK